MQKHFQGLLRRCAPRAAFGGANRHPRLAIRSPLLYRSDVVLPLKAQPKKKRNAKAFFQGLHRRCAPRAAFRGANRHPRITFRSPLLCRSDVVLPLKAQPKKMRNAKAFFSGTTSSLRSSCRRKRRGEPTSEISSSFSPALSFGCGSSPESATKEKRDAKMHLFFLGALSGTRTLGPLIKSQLLYQLS